MFSFVGTAQEAGAGGRSWAVGILVRDQFFFMYIDYFSFQIKKEK